MASVKGSLKEDFRQRVVRTPKTEIPSKPTKIYLPAAVKQQRLYHRRSSTLGLKLKTNPYSLTEKITLDLYHTHQFIMKTIAIYKAKQICPKGLRIFIQLHCDYLLRKTESFFQINSM